MIKSYFIYGTNTEKSNTHVNGFLGKNDAKCNFNQNYFSN